MYGGGYWASSVGEGVGRVLLGMLSRRGCGEEVTGHAQ